jgi:hypothetical protein
MTPIMWSLVAAALCAGMLGAVANQIAGADGAVANQIAARWGAGLETLALALFMAAVASADHDPRYVRDLLVAGLACALAARLLSLFSLAPVSGPATLAPMVYATAGAPRDSTAAASGPTQQHLRARHALAGRLSVGRGAQLTLTGCATLFYAVAMQQHRTDDVSVVLGLVVVLLAIFAFGYRMIARAEVLGGRVLAIAVAGHLAALGCMVVLGVGTGSSPIGYGSLTLATAQLVLITHHVVRPGRWSPAFATAASCAGLALIEIGLMR